MVIRLSASKIKSFRIKPFVRLRANALRQLDTDVDGQQYRDNSWHLSCVVG